MRFALLGLFALLPLAGCLDDNGMFVDATSGTIPVADDVFLMAENTTFSGSFIFSVHGAPMAELPLPLCQAPAECHYYDIPIVAQDAAGKVLEDVETTATVTLDAKLTWGSAATDLDLYLLRDGTEVARSDAGHVGTTPGMEQISLDVGAGDYQLMVLGWYTAMDAYEVDVTFDFDPVEHEQPA